jgi:hypothetical protein
VKLLAKGNLDDADGKQKASTIKKKSSFTSEMPSRSEPLLMSHDKSGWMYVLTTRAVSHSMHLRQRISPAHLSQFGDIMLLSPGV